MNKKNVIIFISLIAIVVAIIFTYETGVKINNNKKCEEYTQRLSGYTYHGHDSTTTVKHGNVSYSYYMELNEDGSCNINFTATRSGDKSTFAENGTTEFPLNDLTWKVVEDSGYFYVRISGETDWRDWSAAKIDPSIEIIVADDEEVILKAVRSGYYDFYFRPTK